jgi:5-bromo-4-chloroindolyl phosphate hydrolysis protein
MSLENKLTPEDFIEMERYLYSNINSNNSQPLSLVLAKQKDRIIKSSLEEAREKRMNLSGELNVKLQIKNKEVRDGKNIRRIL